MLPHYMYTNKNINKKDSTVLKTETEIIVDFIFNLAHRKSFAIV